ncbi:MAG: cell division protein FtsL [Azoarcus sp.]|jgi:cell division protein FtsL|nr:cell division protein FtsL [Azoarcus sp.]
MIRVDAFLIALLFVLAAASALGVISSQHRARKLYTALEYEQRRVANLEEDWRRLQLEQGVLTEYRHVERIARERLRMAPPGAGQIVALEDRP